MRKAKVLMYESVAGIISESDEGYHFKYEREYLKTQDAEAVSLAMPLQEEEYFSKILFPFFDGLIPEGWILDIAVKNWKLDLRDRMSILLTTCQDCIGAVSIIEIKNDEDE